MGRADKRRAMRSAGYRRSKSKGGSRPAIRFPDASAGASSLAQAAERVMMENEGVKVTQRDSGLVILRKRLAE